MKFRLLILTAALVVMAFGLSHGAGEAVYLDHVDGLVGLPGDCEFNDGATLTFHFHIVGSDAIGMSLLNNGIEFCSAELTWSADMDTTFNAAYAWATWFDFIHQINVTSWVNGTGCDTAGLGLLYIMGTGLPIGFDDEAFTITVKNITGPEGSTLVVDSCWYPPSNPWMWGTTDAVPVTIYPAWGGPYTFTLVPPVDVSYGDGVGLPTVFALGQNYPNPFNPVTEVRFDVPRRSDVTISVYNILGHRVKTLVNKELAAGTYVATWDGTDEGGSSVSSGVYFYRMNADGFVANKKMILVK